MTTADDPRLDLLVGHALGALTPDERAACDRWLEESAEAREELARLRADVARLGLAAPEAALPPDLKARVLARAFERRPPARSGVAAATTAGVEAAPSRWPWLAAAASLLLAAGLAALAWHLNGRLLDLQAQLADARREATAVRQDLVALRTASEGATAQLAVLLAPDSRRIDLAGQAVAPGASARAWLSPSRGLVFEALNLPAVPAGRTYQLWIVTANAPVSAAVFTPDADGTARLSGAAPPSLEAVAALAVTLEPGGGVPAPTGDKYLVGLVPATAPSP